jgi:endonuclease/exonuclease/phosphatase family metal-dependent hydrolase
VTKSLRIATYNIHKCVGIDRKYSPERIVKVLREIDADVIGLQEVLFGTHLHKRDDQAKFIADSLGFEFVVGKNRQIKGADYGNAIISRHSILSARNHDITVSQYEPRGCLMTEVEIMPGKTIHFADLHMGTSFFERREQVHNVLSGHVLEAAGIAGHRIIVGDFNEWTNGVTTRMFRSRFNCVDPKMHLGTSRSFPGFMPLLHLDHIYFDSSFELEAAGIHRSRSALVASDHLPIFADFRFL